jgi:predicted nucleic acid-binding protein
VNVADSSAWLEYLGDGPNAEKFAAAIEDPDSLVVPTIVLFEVFKRTKQLLGEAAAFEASGLLLQGNVVDLSAGLALDAAVLSAEFGLPMADSVILATAQAQEATLWTQDAHFRGFANREFLEKR